LVRVKVWFAPVYAKVCTDPTAQKPVEEPESEIEVVLPAVAVRVPEIEPPADADGLTSVVQVAPLARLVDPLVHVPPLSNPKFVMFDSDRATAEDV
jgi:hypothetical protein